MKMENKRKIMIVSGVGIAIVAIAIVVTVALSHPGSKKNSSQVALDQMTENKENDKEFPVLPIGTDNPKLENDTSTSQSDSSTDGKTDSQEQTEPTVKKDDPKSGRLKKKM